MRQLSDRWYDDDWYEGIHGPYDFMEVLTPKISGFLSLTGSLIIMAEVVVDHKQKKGSAISRILFNLSLGDAISSFAYFLSSWPAPRESEAIVAWNIGNEATCSAQGFILNLGIVATPIFNVILAWCQHKVITKGTQERQLQRLEKYFYGIVWSLSLTCSVVLLLFEMYNTEYFVCSIAPYPYTCTESWMADEENPADCIRGDNSFLALAVVYGVLWTAILWVSVLLIKTIRAVREIEKKASTWSLPPEQESQVDSDMGTRVAPAQNLWRTRLMRQHTYRYIAAFLATYLVATIQIVLLNIFLHPVFTPVMAALVATTMPLQGFWNFLVFSGKRQMKTAPGRILKKLTFRVFRRCCCWPKPQTDQEKAQRNPQRLQGGDGVNITQDTGPSSMLGRSGCQYSSRTMKPQFELTIKSVKGQRDGSDTNRANKDDEMKQEEEEEEEEWNDMVAIRSNLDEFRDADNEQASNRIQDEAFT